MDNILPPTPKHAKLEKFVTPKEFDEYKQMAYAKGFLMVASSPLTRSSYHASDDFKIMQNKKKKKIIFYSMKSSNREEVIEHNAKELFDIVLDIESYLFYSWCSAMKIHSKNDKEIYADMIVWYKYFMPQKFGSHVEFDKKKLNIRTTYIERSIKRFKNKVGF